MFLNFADITRNYKRLSLKDIFLRKNGWKNSNSYLITSSAILAAYIFIDYQSK